MKKEQYNKPIFVNITTGTYEFLFDKNAVNPLPLKSHSVYGLDDRGQIWKFLNKQGEWVKLEDINLGEF